MSQLMRALYISRKDMESYYAKPPLITWGLLFPSVLILAIYLKNPQGYMAVAPGIIGMTLLFGNTSMAAIVITFEKRTGTFQRLLLAPVTCRTIINGKAASAALYGIGTSIVLTAGFMILLRMPMAQPGMFAAGILLGAGVFSLMGLIASVMVKEVFEAMTLMNFFRFPLLFLSGVFIPLKDMPAWIQRVAMVSPLTHVVEMLRFGVSGESHFSSPWIPLFAGVTFLAGSWWLAGPIFRRNAAR